VIGFNFESLGIFIEAVAQHCECWNWFADEEERTARVDYFIRRNGQNQRKKVNLRGRKVHGTFKLLHRIIYKSYCFFKKNG